MLHHDFISWLSSDNGLVVHTGIFILLVLGGFGFPIPEDIPIILGGVAASKNIVDVRAVFLVCYVGVVLSDQVMFLGGYLFGPKLMKHGSKMPVFRAVTPEKMEEIREGLRRRQLFYIFLARHLFPLRSVTFLTAGALRVPFLEFFLSDAFAGLVSVSIVLSLGYLLGEKLTPPVVKHLVDQAHYYILLAVLICLVGWLVSRHFRKSKPVSQLAPDVVEDAAEDNSVPETISQQDSEQRKILH
jgi:membrane protein DedA with SNARE-associated domain